jgi:hypothetical protein
MKFTKYLVALAFAFCAFTSNSKAQLVVFNGGGSSALELELGSASQHIPGVTCLWSHAKQANSANPGYMAFRDTRFSLDEQGDWWVAWSPGASGCSSPDSSTKIYSYMKLDSVQGDRCYFATNASGVSGCTLILTNMTLTGGSIIPGTPDNPPASTLPATIVSALTDTTPISGSTGAFMNVAGTDIRPEDALFQTQRMFTACNAYMPRQYFNQDSFYLFGLGYQTTNPNLGTAIKEYSGAGTSTFNVTNFAITGTDPVTGGAVPAYSVSAVGAQPILVAVSPTSDGNIAGFSDIPAFTLALYLSGILGRTSDILGGVSTDEAMTVAIREPLSGTYNTMEYSIPNGTQFHASQDYGNCSGANVGSNPLNLPSANGNVGSRIRAIGTGDEVKFLQNATAPTLGYFFWSAGNAASLTKGKYLKVNGVDPLLNTYQGGVLPGTGASYSGCGGTCTDPGLSAVTFAGLNAGDYPIWSALRLVGRPSDAAVAAMITALGVIDSSQNDYIPLRSLNVWHSHFYLNGGAVSAVNVSNGNTTFANSLNICTGGLPEAGGDVGGANLLIKNNHDFCSDFSINQGLLNKTQ